MAKTRINTRLFQSPEARVPVQDRGFRFGDGVFETIYAHAGMPYLWKYHLERLNAGLQALRIAYDTAPLLGYAVDLLSENKVDRGMLRLSISRGSGSQGYLPKDATAPTLVIETLPLAQKPKNSISLWRSAYEKISPRALPTASKLSQGVNSTLARMEAVDHDCYDALQLDMHGHIAEASSANLFWRKDEVLYTPSLSTGALAGVTRRRIAELSPYPLQEGGYSLDALGDADEVVLTNSAYGILPVHTLEPLGLAWNSELLAATLNHLRDHDIASNTLALRESLART